MQQKILRELLGETDKSTLSRISEGYNYTKQHHYQLVIMNIYGLLHETTSEYTFFSRLLGSFNNIDHNMDYE
jgi:hypothetical protein